MLSVTGTIGLLASPGAVISTLQVRRQRPAGVGCDVKRVISDEAGPQSGCVGWICVLY